ncbi:SGNH/GDSL hydrolase family protein [Pseudonocardia bannensis]|uniref:SGNH/GDSL hydrolase family protein n=1 Tax=Pseudonocardia bannensis TaxID=630973 RepID=UPI0028B158CD|nr:SGNH/GDSL hydrolase family protein [Pseudonocardia bannensis]
MTTVTVQTVPPTSPSFSSAARRVRALVALGDSTAVGLGDPLPGRGWRGFPALLRDALGGPGEVVLTNLSRTGARMACVRREQLPVALTCRPDVAVLVVGMNDTLRSDFDPVALRADCATTVGALRAAGAHVLMLRYHDHTRVFWLPAPLRRALRRRIEELNAVTDAIGASDPRRIGVLDLHLLPGGYERAAWSVDRLHPSERGHRMLAAGFATLLTGAGFAVPEPVGLGCSGGRTVTAVHRAGWLVVKGVPWLARRGRDLAPVIVQGLASELSRGPAASRWTAPPHPGPGLRGR